MNRDSTVRILRSRFDNVDEPTADVVRAEKRRDGKPMSVHYFDFSEALAKEDFDLHNYLQRSFASEFYKTEGSLQWNYYLYFVVDKPTYDKIFESPLIRQIESDRTFARKFVREQAELNKELDSPFAETLKVGKLSQDIASLWTEELKDAGLGKVADPAAEYTKAIRDYLDGTTEVVKRAVALPDTVANGEFIQNIRWSQFREYPKPGDFEFGTVNLIRGVNGAGKTSLLEAIELCICGAIRRQNSKAPSGARLEVRYRGAQSAERCPSSSLQIYRSRDQSWYGGYSRTGNNLCSNFGRFNFFDSDAAFQLSSSDEAGEIQKAINTLLLGERANRIEERMTSFVERFRREEREATRLLRLRNESVTTVTQQLEQLKAIKDTRPALTEELKAKAEACGWKKVSARPTLSDLATLREGIDGVVEDLEQNREALWWMGRISPASVEREMEVVVNALEEIEKLQEEATKNAASVERFKIQLTRNEAELNTLRRLGEYHNEAEGMSLRGSAEALEEVGARIAHLEEAVRILRPIDLSRYSAVRLTPSELDQQQTAEARAAQRSLRSLQAQIQPLQARLGQVDSLIQEIKALGHRYCEVSPHSEDCPLCGARYDDLSARLESLELAAPVEESLRELTDKAAQEQQRLTKVEQDVETFSKLLRAGELVLGQEKAVASRVDTIVRALDDLSEKLLTARGSQTELRARVTRLKLAGFEEEELEKLIVTAHEEFSLALTRVTIKDNLLALLNEKTRQTGELRKTVRDAEKAATQFQSKIEQVRTRCFRDSAVEDRDIELERRSEALGEVVEQLKEIRKRVSLADDEGFATAEKRLTTLSKTVERIQQAFRGIEEKDILEQQLTSTLNQAQMEVARLTPRQGKAKKAVQLLERLGGDDYKERYLRQLRAEHSEKISKIFCHIHAPHEFKSVSLDQTVTLARLNGASSQISEISAGQRAALAISIFLSLNSSVTPRAPWLLFDDPVVHVDDLNVLSFFDTLRDLVLLDDRQVFFATASGRVADLFAKKFDFLGSNFVQIHIKR